MTTVVYRHWQPGDDAGVMAILGPMGWCTPEYYAGKLDDPGLHAEDILIAEQEGRIVGHLMLPHRRLRFGQATVPFGGIGMVVVDSAARGQGIGARLLDEAMAHHRRAGNVLAGLLTMPTLLPAYSMYERRGFVPVARRVLLYLPLTAVGRAPAGLSVRPATNGDRPGLAALIDAWASEHTGVSVEAGQEILDGDRVVVDQDGMIVGRFQSVERGGVQQARRVLVRPDLPVAAVLALSPTAAGSAVVAVATNRESRIYAELGQRAIKEETDGSVLMLASLQLARLFGGLALELAARLRRLSVAPVRLGLAQAGQGEVVELDWDGRVLTVRQGGAAGATVVSMTAATLLAGLAGQPSPPPEPWLADIWAVLFPVLRTDGRLVDCW